MDAKRIIVQWMEFSIPKIQQRHYAIDLSTDFIWTIIGARRTGKTYFCFQIIQQLIEQGITRNDILYINFEDERLLGASADDLTDLLDAYYELTNSSKKRTIYLFLDEIQNVANWDAWVRRIHDTDKGIKLVLTGSSSKLLSKEISTRLRGRVLSREIYPLSFAELLAWEEIAYDQKTIAHSKRRYRIKQTFEKYLVGGGFPAVVTNPHLEEEILQSYYDSMIFRDIVERHNIKDAKKLKMVGKMLFERVANDISYSKLANKLKSAGYDFSKNTIVEYLSHFEDAYIFFQNLKYEYSLTKQLGAIKKLYCIDNGLLNAVSFKFSKDFGTLLENAAYIALKRAGKEVYYHRQSYECDFLIKSKNRVVEAIQVTRALTDENRAREIRGLIEAMKEYKMKKGTIIVHEGEENEEVVEGMQISYIPAWRWFLQV